MKKIINILMILVGLTVLAGCSYGNYQDDPSYAETYPELNSGWYVNDTRPYLVLNDTLLIPAVYDNRIIGQWLIGDEQGGNDSVFTISPDNLLYINNELVGEWYWGESNILWVYLYQDGSLDAQNVALRIDFIDGADDFAQFTEYTDNGYNSAFLGVRVD